MMSGPGSPSSQTLPPDVIAALVQGQMNSTNMAPPLMNTNMAPPQMNAAYSSATGYGGQAAMQGCPPQAVLGHPPQAVSERLQGCFAEPWSTGMVHLDQWLQQHMMEDCVFDHLAQLPMAERRAWVGATMNRQSTILNVTKYILACCKKKSASPMGAPGGQAPLADMARAVRAVARPWRNEAGNVNARGWAGSYSLHGAAGTQLQQAVPQQTSMHIFGQGQQLVQHASPMFAQPAMPPAMPPAVVAGPEAEPPEWVKDAMVDVSKPSAFVSKVKAQLTPAQQTIVGSLPCASQHRLCFALVLLRSSWAEPGSAMEVLLRTYGQLLPEQGIGSQLAAVKKELRMVVLHCCSGIGTSHIVMQGAMRILATARPDVRCSVVESYSFEVDADALSVESGLITEMGLACSQLGSIDNLPVLLQQNGPRWLQMNLLVAFL